MRYFVAKTVGVAGLVVALLFHSSAAVWALDTSDPFRDELWYLDNISAPEAWNTTTGDRSVIVAVLDAGFDLDHEDLRNQYWSNTDELDGNTTDDDRNGFEDDVVGWDFVDNDNDPSPDITTETTDQAASHGTIIAGIIGATADNGKGIVGINWDVSIMPLRVLNEQGSGSTTAVRRAVEYAVENGADVISLSFVFTQTDERLRDTIEWAHDQGVVIVAAAGNGGIDTATTPVYPACFDKELGRNIVIGVGATTKQNTGSFFSNLGKGCIDLSAPGEDIFGAVYHDPNDLFYITAYASPWQGTSFAAPMVAGAAALLLAEFPTLTPDQVRNSLKLAVDPIRSSALITNTQLGSGRLNITRALEYAKIFALGRSGSSRTVSTNSTGTFVMAQGRGASPEVKVIDPHGEITTTFYAYNQAFTGGVRLAVGDVDGDGEHEIVTGAGPSGGPQVRIFNMAGQLESQFFAFDETSRTGIHIAVGDVNADGVEEIIVTEDQGGTGQVKIFNKYGDVRGSYEPYGRTREAIRVAIGQLDQDAELEIVSTVLDGGIAKVSIHESTGKYVRSFNTSMRGSVSISTATGDINGDGLDEVFLGSGWGNTPEVGVYNRSGNLEYAHFVFPMNFQGGIELAVGDIDENGRDELYVTPKFSGGPQVRIFDEAAGLLGSFFVFNNANRHGGYLAI